ARIAAMHRSERPWRIITLSNRHAVQCWRADALRQIEPQEGGCRVAGTSGDLAGGRPIGDGKQQAYHQVAQQQPGELLGHFGRVAVEKSGRLSLGHYLLQGRAARLASYGVQRPCDLGRAHRLGDRKPEYGNHGGITYFALELRPEDDQSASERL